MRKCLYACGLGLRSSELQYRTLSASGLGPTCKKSKALAVSPKHFGCERGGLSGTTLKRSALVQDLKADVVVYLLKLL